MIDLPRSAKVQQLVSKGGSTITYLEVALDVLSSWMEGVNSSKVREDHRPSGFSENPVEPRKKCFRGWGNDNSPNSRKTGVSQSSEESEEQRLIARDIEERRDELRFLRDCLLGGHSVTQMTCALADASGEQDDVKDNIRKTFSGSTRESRRRSSRTVNAPQDEDIKSSSTRVQTPAKGSLSEQPKPVIPRVNRQWRGQMSSPSNSLAATPEEALADDSKKSQISGPAGVPWMQTAVDDFPMALGDASSKRIAQIFKNFMVWDFDIFELVTYFRRIPLQLVGWEAFRFAGCFGEFSVDPAKASRFLAEVERRHANPIDAPFHNNIHAADVTQTVSVFLVEFGARAYIDPMDTFAMLFAATIHDMGHDGRNNHFHINAQDELALTYNDRSVLENFHVASAFKLVASFPEANIGSSLERQQWSLLRHHVIDMVMSTDMANHFASVGDFRKLVEEYGQSPADWMSSEDSMSKFRSMVLHTADISNPAKAMCIAERWATRALVEFFRQGDEESRRGLPVSPLCCRKTTSVEGSQIGFLNFIIVPTYLELQKLLPLTTRINNVFINLNKSIWEDRQKNHEPGIFRRICSIDFCMEEDEEDWFEAAPLESTFTEKPRCLFPGPDRGLELLGERALAWHRTRVS
eukprot:TRINITY_DN25483_c0_g1_i1.p1 TRINITY_DN25483_c0_g1~~TRINITY_DN25483_c0_g1_i1.p1  ORF type:complete len:637 (-),score=121.29 TRINITY_DN25483_c0_g1_i1:130-2040(-)